MSKALARFVFGCVVSGPVTGFLLARGWYRAAFIFGVVCWILAAAISAGTVLRAIF